MLVKKVCFCRSTGDKKESKDFSSEARKSKTKEPQAESVSSSHELQGDHSDKKELEYLSSQGHHIGDNNELEYLSSEARKSKTKEAQVTESVSSGHESQGDKSEIQYLWAKIQQLQKQVSSNKRKGKDNDIAAKRPKVCVSSYLALAHLYICTVKIPCIFIAAFHCIFFSLIRLRQEQAKDKQNKQTHKQNTTWTNQIVS